MSDNAEVSKAQFIERIGTLADQMIAECDQDFAMGALLLAAGFIAQSQRAVNEPVSTTSIVPGDPDPDVVCSASVT